MIGLLSDSISTKSHAVGMYERNSWKRIKGSKQNHCLNAQEIKPEDLSEVIRKIHEGLI